MKQFISTFAALAMSAALVVPALATETQNKGFYYGAPNPQSLAELVEASHKKDPTGKTMLDAAKCKKDGSCATPNDYLVMFREMDPKAREKLKSVADVPAFLRRLVKEPGRQGQYHSSCLKPDGHGWTPVLRCFVRPFHQGEGAWIDPDTKEVILLEDCGNPTPGPAPLEIIILGGVPACMEIPFPTGESITAVRFAVTSSAGVVVDVTDPCFAVKRAGSANFEKWAINECENVYCDFSAPASMVKQEVRLVGSYIPKPGEHVLRVPAYLAEERSLQYRIFLCFDRMIAGIVGHSNTTSVRWFDYRETQSGIKAARVFYTQAEIPAGMPQLYISWGEWGKLHPESEMEKAYRIGKQMGERARQRDLQQR